MARRRSRFPPPWSSPAAPPPRRFPGTPSPAAMASFGFRDSRPAITPSACRLPATGIWTHASGAPPSELFSRPPGRNRTQDRAGARLHPQHAGAGYAKGFEPIDQRRPPSGPDPRCLGTARLLLSGSPRGWSSHGRSGPGWSGHIYLSCSYPADTTLKLHISSRDLKLGDANGAALPANANQQAFQHATGDNNPKGFTFSV